MRRLVGLTATIFGLSAAVVFAQAAPDPSPLPPAPPEITKDNPPPPPPAPGPRAEQRADGKDEWRMPPRGDRPPPPSNAAHFRVRIGDARIDLKCADNEPMKACADLLLQIIDRAKAPSDDRDSGRDYRRDRDRFDRYDRG